MAICMCYEKTFKEKIIMREKKTVEANEQEMAMKRNKIINIVVNVIVAIIAIFVVILASTTIASAKTGYTNLFGYASVSVLSDSMKGDKEDSFNKGDMIFVKILKDEEKASLKEGDVITFYDTINGQVALNTHRIIKVIVNSDGDKFYTTQGDNAPAADKVSIASSEVIGVYKGGRMAGFGAVATFFKGPIGFGIFVVLPSLALLGFAIYKVIIAVKQVKDEEKMQGISVDDLNEEQKAKLLAEEKEKIKAELLAEMNAEESAKADEEELAEINEEEELASANEEEGSENE